MLRHVDIIASMAAIPMGPLSTPPDKTLLIKTANFAQIPSKLSLKSNVSTPKAPLVQQGRIENVHLVSLSKQGKIQEAGDFIKEMDKSGVLVTLHSYECLLEMCSDLRHLSIGKFIHNHLQSSHSTPPIFIQNCAMGMYCECGSFSDSHRLFDEMTERNLASWAILISAYAKAGLIGKAVKLFSCMETVEPDFNIYISILRSLVDSSSLELGKQMHSLAIKNGFTHIVKVDTTILNMYMKCGCLDSAELIFDQMAEKNAVAWTALMVGYMQVEKRVEVLALFLTMVKEGVQLDEYVFSITLKACACMENQAIGQQIHGYVLKLGVANEASVGTPLVDFYVKCGSIESATRAFNKISEPNDFSWSALITGYSQSGEFDECLKIFKSLKSRDAVLNSFIYTSIFQACSAVAAFDLGAQAHGDAIKRGLVSYLYGESAMITMYARCGRLDYARQVFESIRKPDNVTWTAIIAGCAYHGNAPEALRLFRRMISSNVSPNAITFIAVFTAYNYSGLIKEAKECLDSMSSRYGVEPNINHYNCMIDIYARAGRLEESLEMIKNMPFEPGPMSWKCLLGGCSIHKNFKLGKIAAENLLRLDPHDTAAFVLMFNLHASYGNWEEAGLVRKMMAERNLRKEIFCLNAGNNFLIIARDLRLLMVLFRPTKVLQSQSSRICVLAKIAMNLRNMYQWSQDKKLLLEMQIDSIISNLGNVLVVIIGSDLLASLNFKIRSTYDYFLEEYKIDHYISARLLDSDLEPKIATMWDKYCRRMEYFRWMAFCIKGLWSAYIYQGILQETKPRSTKNTGRKLYPTISLCTEIYMNWMPQPSLCRPL